MARRNRVDSAAEAVKAMVEAALGLPDLPPHAFLRDGDRPFWVGVVRARARDEWTDSDLIVSCQLARTQADIEVHSRALDVEGAVLKTDKGTPIANPLLSVLDMLCRREMALMRALRMGGRAAGDPRDEIPRRAAAQVAQEALEAIPDDGLLAS